MGENPYEPPEVTLDDSADLGRVLVTCQDRSEKERLEAMDQSLIRYFLIPFWVPIIPVAFVGFILQRCSTPGKQSRWTEC